MDNILDQKVKDLAIENDAYIEFFHHHNVDFYCNGKLTLKQALQNANVETEVFLDYAQSILNETPRKYGVKIEEWPLDLLADYIHKTHHQYTEQTLVELKSEVKTFLKDHENQKLTEFQTLLERLAKELGGHMKKEELILFPHIRKLMLAKGELSSFQFKTVVNPIHLMIHEHTSAFELLQSIRSIFEGYKYSEENYLEVKLIIQKMEELDRDLTLHLHLENNILFPKVVMFEKNRLNL